jgi:hypothetical protein
VLYDLLQLGKDARAEVLDEAFIKPKLEGLSAAARAVEPGEKAATDDRLV